MSRKSHPVTKIIIAYAPAVIWASLIFFLSAQEVLPGFTVSLHDFLFKKSAHMFVYGVLFYLLLRATRQHSGDKSKVFQYALPLLITLAYACIDEWHQSTVPGRYPTGRDIAYDMLGATTVLLHQLKLL
jgi:hypothetical protein